MDMRPILIVPFVLALAACDRTRLAAPSEVIAQSTRTTAGDGSSGQTAPEPPAAVPQSAAVPMPAPEALTDSAISGRIGSELSADPGMAGSDVTVHTDRGVVTLSGTVKTHEQTGIASAHAQSQDGVLRVDNHLRPALS